MSAFSRSACAAALVDRASLAACAIRGRLPLQLATVLLAGCATATVDGGLARINDMAAPYANARAELARTPEQRRSAIAVIDALLDKPMDADAAVQMAFANSAALQVLLAQHAAATAGAIQDARAGNPVLTLDRLVRGDVREIGRLLTIGVADLLALPARARIADARINARTLRTASEVVQLAFDVRQAWVMAVSAQQMLSYTADVRSAAEAGNELARRMFEKGNYSRLQRAREQASLADTVAQYARSERSAVAARERLIRLLGLDRQQAARLVLPERLPDLPAAPRAESQIRDRAFEARLDIQVAQAELQGTARTYGLTRVTRWVDGTRFGLARNSESGAPVQRGWELELPLPLFDLGDARQADAEAAYLAALYRTSQVAVEAQSEIYQAYRAYLGAFDIARQYRDEIVPLRAAIAEENLLLYNGMLVSVFEVLADARERVGSVIAAIEAQRDFWLADTTLDSALVGRPLADVATTASMGPATVPAVKH